LAGVKQLLNDPHATGLALALYQHAAVNPLGNGVAPIAPTGWLINQRYLSGYLQPAWKDAIVL
jgi:hypothetical protein